MIDASQGDDCVYDAHSVIDAIPSIVSALESDGEDGTLSLSIDEIIERTRLPEHKVRNGVTHLFARGKVALSRDERGELWVTLKS